MDGSIADSTVLRVRTQLQRLHHASPTSPADGFLEELLKLPATKPVDNADDAPTPEEPALDSLPTSAAARTDNEPRDTDKPSEDRDESDDNALPTPNIPLCYGPAPITMPETDQPTVETTAPTTMAEPTALQTAVVDESGTATVELPDTSVTADQSVTLPVDDDLPAAKVVEPIVDQAQPPTKDNLAQAVRENRRVKEPREQAAPTSQRIEPMVDQRAVTADAQPLERTEAPASQDQAQPVDQSLKNDASTVTQPEPNADDGRHRDDDRSQPDKWYENSSHGSEETQASTAELMSEMRKEQANDDSSTAAVSATNPTDVSAAAADANATAVDAGTQAILDNSQLASDMAAAAQANLAQAAGWQSVTEATGAAGVDAAGRSRGAGGGSGAGNGLTGTGLTGTGTAGGIGSANGANGVRGTAPQGSSAASSAQESPDGAREITQQERVRLVQRVARSFSRLGPEGGQVTLKLHPPQLGVLNVSIKIEGQTMTARLQTETSAARDTIVENLPVLRDRLSEQGIEIEKFHVEVGHHDDLASGSGQAGGFTGNGANSQQGDTPSATEFDYRRDGRGNASRRSMAAPIVMEPRTQGWAMADRSLDVRA